MTIEIRQLVIRAVVGDRPAQNGPSAATATPERGGGRAAHRPGTPPTLPAEDRQAIVAACVREVLRKLDRAGER